LAGFFYAFSDADRAAINLGTALRLMPISPGDPPSGYRAGASCTPGLWDFPDDRPISCRKFGANQPCGFGRVGNGAG